MKQKPVYVLDLFAGCGGLSKGFEAAGFNIVAANEIWHPAVETYAYNHPKTIMIEGDITDKNIKKRIIDTSKGKVDVIIGGPPCQAYSMSGRRDTKDPRGRLFEDYVDIVANVNPKFFVMENVKGILSIMHDKEDLSKNEKKELAAYRELERKRDLLLLLRKRNKNNPSRFRYGERQEKLLDKIKLELKNEAAIVKRLREPVTDQIIRRFSEIGYKVKYQVLDSANYGVPQRRERVIFIGTKCDIDIFHPEPTHMRDDQSISANATLLAWKTVREAIDDLKNVPDDEKISHVITKHSEAFEEKIRNTPLGKSVFGYSDAFFRNKPNEPSRTVKENHGGVLIHYEKNRVMTPRELARLQSFPDKFIFKGTKSSILKQIGNAVPPELGRAIGLAIKTMLLQTEIKHGTNKKSKKIKTTARIFAETKQIPCYQSHM